MLPKWLRDWAIRTHHLPESASDAEIQAALRQLGGPEMNYRQVSLPAADGQRSGPATWNEETRSVEAIIASEAPVPMYDWERGETVDEILLMSGVELPKSRQVPLLNSHSRWAGITDQLGSTRDIRADGAQLIAANHFADTALGRDGAALVRDGHTTDFSVGYQVYRDASVFVPKGETQKVAGRSFTATKDRGTLIRTKWRLHENSLTPIGADPTAKARSLQAQPTTPTAQRNATTMNKKLLAILHGMGLRKDASDQEARQYLADHLQAAMLQARAETDDAVRAELVTAITTSLPDAAPAPAQRQTPAAPAAPAAPIQLELPSEQRQLLEQLAETNRQNQIRALGEQYGIDAEHVNPLVADRQVTIEQAQVRLAQQVLKQRADAPTPRYQLDVLVSGEDTFRAAVLDSLLRRGSIALRGDDGKERQPAAGHGDFMAFSLRELARECLIRANIRPPSNLREMVMRAFTTSDFVYVLANSATKALAEGYMEEAAGWRLWAAIGGGLSDFKVHTENRVYEVSAFQQVREDEEYQHVTRSEKPPESYQIAKYGGLFGISEETIRNDDLGALTDIPKQFGEESARLVADVVYAVLTANGTMGDSVALFHADHSNLVDTGSGAAPGTATFDAAELAMSTQLDGGGRRRLMIEPKYFVGPRKLKGAAEVFFSTDRFHDSDTATTRMNRWFRSVETDYNSRLDDHDNLAWYLLGPKGKTVVVRFLDGRETPDLWSRDGWRVDGIEYKARVGVVAYARDYRAMYKNEGQ